MMLVLVVLCGNGKRSPGNLRNADNENQKSKIKNQKSKRRRKGGGITPMVSPQVAYSSSHAHRCADDILRDTTNADLQALQDIISTHFHKGCRDRVSMQTGAYARVFLFTLADDRKVIARVVLPIRETVKTEAEVAAMEFVRGTPFLFPYLDTYRLTAYPPSSPNPNTRPTSIPLLLHVAQSSTSRMNICPASAWGTASKLFIPVLSHVSPTLLHPLP
jgi:hypothetical protein